MPPSRRAETLAWMFVALNTIEPPVNALSLMDLQHQEEEWVKLRRPGAVDDVTVRFAALSEGLDDLDYLLVPFTAADILMTAVLGLIRHTRLLARVAMTAY